MATRTNTRRPAPHDADSHDLIRVHGRAGEQPQGHQRRDPQAPADGVHRRLRLGQELAGVRHDRRRVAADDQRDLQRVRAGLHADAGAARGRPARGPDDGDHRRPGADGRQPPLHRRHRHRRQRDAAHPVQPARQAARRPAHRLLLQRPDADGERGDDHRQGRPGEKTVVRNAVYLGGMCPRCEGMGAVSDFDLTALYDDTKSLSEGALTIPGYSMDGWYGRIFSGAGFFDMDKPIAKFTKKELHDLLYTEPTKIKVEGINLTYEGVIPKIQKSMLSKDVDGDAAARPALRRAGGHLHDLPRVRRHPAQHGGAVLEDRGQEHRRRCARCRSATSPTWVRDLDEPSVAPLLARAAAPARLVRRDRAGLPLARPAGGHAVRRRGAAHQDDPPPRLVADRRHLRLRRADDRAAPARHRADERAAAAAARQGQHRARRRAQAGDDRDRRPRRRPRPRRRHRRAARSASRAPSRGCGGATPSPAATSTTGPPLKDVGADAVRRAGGARRVDAQPAGRRRRHPARRAVRDHRRRRLGQELADPRLGRRPRRRRGRSTRARSAARGAATRRRTPGCSTRSARRSRRPTA